LQIETELENFASLVNEEIRKLVPAKEFPNFYDGMAYTFQTGGKRLRPALCLMICKTLGGDIENTLPFAVSLEVIHNATLVHDDIEDGDEERRNFPTVWKKYGIAHGVNIGDGMFFKAYESLFRSKNSLPPEKIIKLSEMLSSATLRIMEGQSMEFNFRKRDDVTVEEYLDMVLRKTGFLLGTALRGGAFIAGASEETCNLTLAYGKKMGSAFQIRDDILNLIGEKEKYGKEIGGDIKEGKRTLITIHCLSKCNASEREKILGILKKSREKVADEEVEFVMKIIKKYDSINFAQQYSEKLIGEAKELLKNIGNIELKKTLEEFSNFMIERER